MWRYKYGCFDDEQMNQVKLKLRKQIYFLLLYVDSDTCDSFPGIDVNMAFDDLLTRLDGLNGILRFPCGLVGVISLLESARKEYNHQDFDFYRYRKLILDAGSEIMRIEG